MWVILNSSFLGSRGAIFPALQDSGEDASPAISSSGSINCSLVLFVE